MACRLIDKKFAEKPWCGLDVLVQTTRLHDAAQEKVSAQRVTPHPT
jgi:hypothetical protein